MRKLPFILPLALVLLSGCEKQLKKTKVSGVVVDYCQGTPVEGASVWVYYYEENGVIVGAAGAINTGTDGTFDLNFKALKRIDRYFLEARKDGYYANLYLGGLNYTDSLVKKKENQYFTYKLMPKADLVLVAENQTPFDNGDEICITDINGNSGNCETGNNFNGVINAGWALGNCYNVIEYDVTKNQVTQSYVDSFFAVPNETTTYTIYY